MLSGSGSWKRPCVRFEILVKPGGQAAAGFALQGTSALSPPATWLAETNEPVITNNTANVTMATLSNRFYRLVLP